jgi:hypothetical protein
MLRVLCFALAVAAVFCLISPDLHAGVVVPGSTFTITGSDDPSANSFTSTATLNGGPTLIDNGLLSVTETITSINPTTDWVQFTFTTTSGGSLAGDPSAFWEIQVSNIQTSKPSALAAYFTYFSLNGTAESPIYPFFGGAVVEPDPLNPSVGPVWGATISPPYTNLSSSQTLYAYITPWTFGEDGGINPSSNGLTLAGEYVVPSSAVPEPASLATVAVGLLGLTGFALKKRRAS